MIFKRIFACALAAALTAAPALAEVYIGTTIARSTLSILSPADAMIESLHVQAGMEVSCGDVIAQMRTTKVFANQDGTIARIDGSAGQEIDGVVLELQPVSQFDIYCTLDGGYDSIANNIIRCGEEIYIKCTENGTHQGVATVTGIDGETFMAAATGGEFYNGETLYLYRDPGYDYPTLLGTGTVVAAATEIYRDTGRITAMHVQEGEFVQRGELLYEIISGEGALVTAPADGIITACSVSEGETASQNGAIAAIATRDEICIAIQVDESAAACLSIGDDAAMTYACDNEELLVPGSIIEISSLPEDGLYTVHILPEVTPAYLGMTVNVRIGA